MLNEVIHGDALAVLRGMETHSVDAIVKRQSLYHAILRTYGSYGIGKPRYLLCLRRLVSQMSLQALCDVRRALYGVYAYLYGIYGMCNHLASLLLFVGFSSQVHNSRDSRRAMPGCFHLYDRHYSNQGYKKRNRFYFAFAMPAVQNVSGNLCKLELLSFLVSFCDWGYLRLLALPLSHLEYRYKALLQPVSLHLLISRHSDIYENKKQHVLLLLSVQGYARLLYRNKHKRKVFLLLCLAPLVCLLIFACWLLAHMSIYGYKSFDARILAGLR